MTRFGWAMTTYLTALTIAVAALFHPAPKLLWNASASVPIGLYAVHRAGALHIGDLLVVTPPKLLSTFLDQRHYLPKGVPLLKRVVALPGQTVCRIERTIFVDGVAIGDALGRDHLGRPLPGLARLPPHRRRTSLPDEPTIPGLPRRPLFRAAADHHHRRPRRSALDSREGLTMPKLRIPDVIAPPSSRLRPSSFPVLAPLADPSPAASHRLRWRPLLAGATAFVLLIIGPVANAQPITDKPPIVSTSADRFAVFVAEAAQRFGISPRSNGLFVPISQRTSQP